MQLELFEPDDRPGDVGVGQQRPNRVPCLGDKDEDQDGGEEQDDNTHSQPTKDIRDHLSTPSGPIILRTPEGRADFRPSSPPCIRRVNDGYFRPQFWAFQVTPTLEAFGRILPYVLDHAVMTGFWYSGSVTMLLHSNLSAALYSVASKAGFEAAAACLSNLSSAAFLKWTQFEPQLALFV